VVTNNMGLAFITDEKLLTSLKTLCNQYFEDNGFIGMSVGIIKDGKIAYLPYGVMEKDGDSINESTLFDIASLTKTFTGILFADLVLEGKLGYDDELQKFYPTLNVKSRDDTAITLRILANHTSGYTKHPENYRSRIRPAADDYDAMAAYSERRMFAYMENANLPFTPGTKYSYSNIGYTVLGCVGSMVEEKPFNQILQERICSKIGMLNTATRLTEEQEKIHVFGHDENGEIIRKQYTPPDGYYMLEACGGIKSNAHDMVNYLAANLGCFETDLNAAIRESHKVHYDNNGNYPKIGLGWHILKHNGGDIYTHGGHVGGHRSYMAFSLNSKAGVVIMINRNGNPDALCLQLLTKLR